MLHEAKDRQKFVSDVQYLRDMQHKVDSEYQACLRRQEYKRDPNEKKRDQFWGQETNFERSRFSSGSSSKQISGDEDAQAEPRLSATSSACKTDSRLPAIDQTSVKQKHKSTMTPKKSEKAGPSKPPPGDSSEHPLFCVEYSPFCSVFAFSPVLQPNTSYCCLLLPLVPPASPAAGQDSPLHLPPAPFPRFLSPSPSSPGPVPESPATLCYFPISSPRPIETPVLCLPGPRQPSKIYLVW
ncbi:probable E3 ubiquitin-protein ligase MARCHF10 isoform X6 [Odocoileus virginianus]|uniref:RING-type E3 ubiquitin transferase n=1 Tax=Odocoileus virginianus TaxID=9874 RepID=A0ABM4J6H9_ODOVR